MKKMRGYLLKPEDVTLIVFVPAIVFTASSLAIGMISPAWRFMAYIIVFVCLFCSVGFVCVGIGLAPPPGQEKPSTDRRVAVTYKSVGFLSLFALIAGFIMGLLADYTYMDEYNRLKNGAVYHNIDPATPKLHQDAAVITFEPGAIIDTDRTVGYQEAGEVYCVAPVSSSGDLTSPAFFAAGTDCCGKRSHFDCSEVDVGGMLKGIVLKKDDAWDTAIRMDGSVYSLKLPEKRTAVKVVKDADRYINDLWDRAFIYLVMCCCMQGFLCIVTGIVLRNLLRDPSRSLYSASI